MSHQVDEAGRGEPHGEKHEDDADEADALRRAEQVDHLEDVSQLEQVQQAQEAQAWHSNTWYILVQQHSSYRVQQHRYNTDWHSKIAIGFRLAQQHSYRLQTDTATQLQASDWHSNAATGL